MREPTVVINDTSLTEAQAMTLRVAVTDFLSRMGNVGELGEDQSGEGIRQEYFARSSEIVSLMLSPAAPSLAIDTEAMDRAWRTWIETSSCRTAVGHFAFAAGYAAAKGVSEPSSSLVALREKLRLSMLQQQRSGKRETFTDGFAQGLAFAIAGIDEICDPASVTSVIAEPPPPSTPHGGCPCGDNDGLWCSLPGCPYPKRSLSSSTPDRISIAAKAMADSIGHGMREKCLEHAKAVVTALDQTPPPSTHVAGCGSPDIDAVSLRATEIIFGTMVEHNIWLARGGHKNLLELSESERTQLQAGWQLIIRDALFSVMRGQP